MADSLEILLVTNQPPDTAGAMAANRFGFQRAWALCKMLDLHSSGADYLIVFDYHDDVLILNAASGPTEAHFYQIKTKKSAKTMAALIKREQSKTAGKLLPSILGKLYSHRVTFGPAALSLNLVSTTRYTIPLNPDDPKSTTRDQFVLSEVAVKELGDARTALTAEHSLPGNPEGEDTICFVYSSLSLDDHDTHATGRMAEFLEATGRGGIRPGAAFQAVKGEIERRNNCETRPTTFPQMCQLKALSRSEVESMLSEMHTDKSMDDAVDEIRNQLRAAGIPGDRILALTRQCRNYFVEKFNPANTTLTATRAVIADIVQQAAQSNPALVTVMNAVTNSTDPRLSAARDSYSPDFLTAIAILVHYGQ